MPPAIVAEIILTALKIWLRILEDMPDEERRKAWVKWFEFWDLASAHLPAPSPPPKEPKEPT